MAGSPPRGRERNGEGERRASEMTGWRGVGPEREWVEWAAVAVAGGGEHKEDRIISVRVLPRRCPFAGPSYPDSFRIAASHSRASSTM